MRQLAVSTLGAKLRRRFYRGGRGLRSDKFFQNFFAGGLASMPPPQVFGHAGAGLAPLVSFAGAPWPRRRESSFKVLCRVVHAHFARSDCPGGDGQYAFQRFRGSTGG